MKSLNPTFLAVVLATKVILGSLFLCWMQADPVLSTGEAVAADQKKEAAPAKDATANLESVEKSSVDALLKRSVDLEKRERELEKRRVELAAIQDDINGKIAKLEQIRNEIRSHVETKRAFEEQKLKHLVKAYSAMKPQAAANVIEKLDLGFAVEILSRMQGDTVGGILSFVEKEKAAKISESLAKQK
jgi:flagellar motility protein MotE (MotC chaperone)